MSTAVISIDVDDYLDKASSHALVREVNARTARGSHILDELIDEDDIIDNADTEVLINELESRGYQITSDEEVVIHPRDWRIFAEYIAQGDIKEAFYFMESLNLKGFFAGVLLNQMHRLNQSPTK